jgi:endonuclease/exonuclease/phosphatase family metal-dependent hydrolase
MMRKAASLRVGTWNLDTGGTREVAAQQRLVLAAQRADVWVLTETRDDITPGRTFIATHAEQQDLAVSKDLVAGNRWVSIFARDCRRARLPVSDAQRTVAVLLEYSPIGRVIIFGTVMPWPASKPGYSEAAAAQAADWRRYRSAYPDASLIVAGDFNCDMDKGANFPGEAALQELREAMAECGLVCATVPSETPQGWFVDPPIDHVLVQPGLRTQIVAGWEGTLDGHTLSDHSGMIVEVQRG